jgi:hypothetical protein
MDRMFWNEHGERVQAMLSSSDASINDIPRIMREHRDLRRSLAKALDLLEQSGFVPENEREHLQLNTIRDVKNRNPI